MTHENSTTTPTSKTCASCKHRGRDIQESPCATCFFAGIGYANYEPARCGGTKCSNAGCLDCFPAQMPENPKAIYGRAKPSLALIPGGALVPMAKVFELGARKYGDYNWRKDPVELMIYANAALRHLYSLIDGEDLYPESGESHAAHAAACMGIILDARACGTLIDNRPYAGQSAALIRERTQAVA
jgi:hypothetical protein